MSAEKTKSATGKTGRPAGGNILANVVLESKKPVKANDNFTPASVKYKVPEQKCSDFRCCMCGETYTTQKGNFLKSGQSPLWKGNNGYLPFCRSCCITLFNSLVDFYSGNEEHAMKHICATFDWYYSPMAYSMTLAQMHHGGSVITLYPSKANTRQVIMNGTTYLDTVRDDNKENETIDSISEILSPDIQAEDEDSFVVTKEMIKSWGKGYTAEDYEFLEEQYADWCAKNVCNTKSQEEIYRNICMAQLNVRSAMRTGGKVSDAQKGLQDLMSSAAILPRQTAENVLADTQTFGTLLKKYEETDPIPEPADEWKDVDGIRRYMNTWFRGGLAKALKIKNENTELYDEQIAEMKKYSVDPAKEASQESIPDSSIFDCVDISSDEGVVK